MAKAVRVSDQLYRLAHLESVLENRSIAQQIEYWAKLGMASRRVGESRAEYAAAGSLEAAVQATRRLDIDEVRSGTRDAADLHFVPASIARDSQVLGPATYRKSGK